LPVGAGPCACPVPFTDRYPDGNQLNWDQLNIEQPQGVAPTTTQLALTDIMHRFKSFTTSQYRTNVLQNNWPPFPGRLWQRNYYERIVRHENELNRVREYIRNNPARWADDENNPLNQQRGKMI
jgi:hypothetical protein